MRRGKKAHAAVGRAPDRSNVRLGRDLVHGDPLRIHRAQQQLDARRLRCTGQHVRVRAKAELRHAGGTGRQLQPLVHNADAPAEPVGELPDEVAQQRRLAAARRAAQEHGLWPRPERITQAVGNAVRLAGDAQVQGRRLAQGRDRAVLHDGRSADAKPVPARQRDKAAAGLHGIGRALRCLLQNAAQQLRRDRGKRQRPLLSRDPAGRRLPAAQAQLLHGPGIRQPVNGLPQPGRADAQGLSHFFRHARPLLPLLYASGADGRTKNKPPRKTGAARFVQGRTDDRS